MIIAQNLRRWFMEGKLDRNLETTATHRHHIHFHCPTFKSIRHTWLTPALYRHLHAKMVNGKIVKIKKKVVKS